MEDSVTFSPPRQLGLAVHTIMILLLAAGGLAGLSQAARAQAGLTFLLYLLPGGIAVLAIPLLIYRAAALQRSSYGLERDGIRLRWGLRSEDIPMTSVQWVGMASQSPVRLPGAPLGWPGALLSVRRMPDGRPLEFMAARASHLVVILTEKSAFAISPENPAAFLQHFRRIAEYGSLSPIAARSVYPDFLGQRFWADLPARLLVLGAAIASLGLLAWVSLAVPGHVEISLRLTPDGSPVEPVPAVRLLLLPVLNGFFLVLNLLLGVVFYRRRETQALAYLMWGASLLTAVLFLVGVFFILRAA